jgi:AraC family transcriptional regulator of adaptative response / DNA-3-methyladenine glycosylase II
MRLDWQVCSRARLSRDPRFDGRFFIGVLSSGVYCRSICPARSAKEENCRYYPSAAAAAEAGFRPCLRCRPECSPGTPAWLGTSNTVSRAIRLISEGVLDELGEEAFAERLGIGSRHLRRLFLQHLGASPTGVAQTRRLHLAKKLLDETNLSMNYVAIAAGFGCVRRFNDAIRKTYNRTPTQIRRLARKSESLPDGQYSFHLCYRPPYHWNSMLAFFAARATPGVEAVESGTYVRAISLDGQDGHFQVSWNRENNALSVLVRFGKPKNLCFIIERIRIMFDLNAAWHAIAETLGRDPYLKEMIRNQPGVRIPGCWNGFELATRAILGQQITVKGATALAGNLVHAFGRPYRGHEKLAHLFPTPEVLADARIVAIGLPTSRAETIRIFARAVCDGQISLEKVADVNDFSTRLRQIPGIGPWTAQYIAMRALGDPDAFPFGDAGLLRALCLTRARELEKHSEQWRPWRAYAAMYLWNSLNQSICPDGQRASSIARGLADPTSGRPATRFQDATA